MKKVRIGRYKVTLLHKRSQGMWLAFRDRAPPRFYFGKSTKQDALITAGRALKFYRQWREPTKPA